MKILIGMQMSFLGGLKFGHILFVGLMEVGVIFWICENQCHFFN